MSLVDENRQWFKAKCGLSQQESGRDIAFCAHTILLDDVMVVPDATKDARFADNPLVTGEPHIRFYAGVPLKTPDGQNIGTLCVIDTAERIDLTEPQKDALRDLADIVVDDLEMRLATGNVRTAVDDRREALRRLAATESQLRLFIENAPAAIAMFDQDMRYLAVSQRWVSDHHVVGRDIIGRNHYELFPDVHDRLKEHIERCLAGEIVACQEDQLQRPDGTQEWIRWELHPWHYDDGQIGGTIMFTELITESKEARKQIEESRQFLSAVLDNIQDGIVACDAEGRLTLFNKATRRLHGLPERPLPPDQWAEHYDLFRADGETRMSKEEIPLFRAFEGENIKNAKMIIRTKDGTARHIQAFGQPMFSDNGEKLGAVVSMHDTTGRDLAEERYRQSEARFRTLYRKTPALLHSIDAEGRVLNVSELWLDTFGYKRDEVVGRAWTGFLTPASRRHAEDVAQPQFLRKGRCRDVPYQFIKKNGEVVDVLLSAVKETNVAAVDQRTMAVLVDVTEKKKAEQALRQSESRFRGAFATAPHGIALVAPDGRWLEVNKSLCDLLGYGEAELLHTDFQSITHPDDLDADLDLVRQVLDGEITSYQMEKRYIHKDGHVLWILLSVSLVRGDDGEPLHFVSQILDLTERKNAEAQLHQALKMEAVGQLTGGLAHDFNNLLAVVMGNLQLLQRSLKDDEKGLRRVDNALEATTRGAELTKRLLAFSRKQALEPIVLDASELIAGMVELLRGTLGETIELEAKQSEDIWPTQVDPSQLETAVLNLAINARDAMPEGGHLTIESSNVSLDEIYAARHLEMVAGDYVRVSVTDTGTGMPRSLIDQVFQPFFTTKDAGKGSGLGLSMVYGFVNQSGGNVKIYSEEGHGTTVAMYLPRYEGTQEKRRHDVQVETVVVGGDETILVVEDDPAVREMAVSLLEEFGYSVIETDTGSGALHVLNGDTAIDLLFSDVVLSSGMTGIELAQQSRRIRPGLKVLFTSGYASAAVMRKNKSDMPGDLLRKPYRREDLARKVRQVLDGPANG